MTAGTRAGEIVHGGNLHDAGRRFPGAPSPFIDLSTGINPVPYPFARLRPEAFIRLPEPDAVWALQAEAARAYGVTDPAMVVAAPGTQILINLLPHLWPQKAISILGPTYAEHAASWSAVGATVREVPEFEQLGDQPAVLCNPNNPDGRRVAPAELLALADRTRLLVVDEAFADFEGPGLSLAPYVTKPGVILLRSFGKAFGLAGVRLGFAIAEPGTASALRQALGPWAVSGPAIQIACEALRDTAWIDATVQRLDRDVAWLDTLLAGAGCRLIGGTRLFRLVEADLGLFDHLGRAGIFIRAYADRPRQFRFGIPAPDQWDQIQAALARSGPQAHCVSEPSPASLGSGGGSRPVSPS